MVVNPGQMYVLVKNFASTPSYALSRYFAMTYIIKRPPLSESRQALVIAVPVRRFARSPVPPVYRFACSPARLFPRLALPSRERFLWWLRIASHSTSRAPMAVPQAVPQDDVQQLQRLAGAVSSLREQVSRRIVGQRDAVDGILTAILAGGHALLIGVPGLAKTLMV